MRLTKGRKATLEFMALWIGEAGTSNMLKTCHPLSVRIRSVLPIYG